MKVAAEKTLDDCMLRRVITVEIERFLLISFKIHHAVI